MPRLIRFGPPATRAGRKMRWRRTPRQHWPASPLARRASAASPQLTPPLDFVDDHLHRPLTANQSHAQGLGASVLVRPTELLRPDACSVQVARVLGRGTLPHPQHDVPELEAIEESRRPLGREVPRLADLVIEVGAGATRRPPVRIPPPDDVVVEQVLGEPLRRGSAIPLTPGSAAWEGGQRLRPWWQRRRRPSHGRQRGSVLLHR